MGEVVGPETIITFLPVFSSTDRLTATGPVESLFSPERITNPARHRHNIGNLRMF